MHRVADPHSLDRSEGVALVILYQFIHLGAQSLPRLYRIRRAAQLNDDQRHAHVLLHIDWELLEILLRGTFPLERLRFRAMELYPFGYEKQGYKSSYCSRCSSVTMFKMLYTDGPYPGLSNEHHSTFQLHLGLITGRALPCRLRNGR